MGLCGELRTWLVNNVGTLTQANTFVGYASQTATLPYLVLMRDGEDPYNSLGGVGDLAAAELTVVCKGKNYDAAADLAAAVVAALEPYSGAMGDVTCEAVLLNDTYDTVEQPVAGQDYKTFLTTLDLTIQYRES